MSSEQLLVLVLLAAAFAAGWFARGGRSERTAGDEAAAAPPVAASDPVLTEADEALDRAMTAARAARAVALGPAGVSEAATRAVLGVLDQRLHDLEACADRLESTRGDEDPAFAAYDRVVSGFTALRMRIEGDAALEEVEDARAGWQRATAV